MHSSVLHTTQLVRLMGLSLAVAWPCSIPLLKAEDGDHHYLSPNLRQSPGLRAAEVEGLQQLAQCRVAEVDEHLKEALSTRGILHTSKHSQ